MIELENFRNISLESSVLQNLMGNYRFPRNKVSALEKRGKKNFETPFGNFDYTTVSSDYFSIGLRQEIIENQYDFLIILLIK